MFKYTNNAQRDFHFRTAEKAKKKGIFFDGSMVTEGLVHSSYV